MLAAVEQGLEGRDYFTGEFTAADIITGQATIVSARLGGDISTSPMSLPISSGEARPAYQRAVDAALGAAAGHRRDIRTPASPPPGR